MKILMVSSYLPYPLFSGGHIRLYNLIKLLSKKHEITLVCEKRDYQGKMEIDEMKKFCKKVIVVPRKKQWSATNIIKTGLSFSSFLITGHTSFEMKKEIKTEIVESEFDLIHIETSYVMQNIPSTYLPMVLAEHNVEYLVYKRFADKTPLLLKPLLYFDVLKLKGWEEKMWRRVTKLVAVSETEKKIMEKKRKDVIIVPNGVDIDKFKPTNNKVENKSSEKRILFIGEFKWVQNIDAIEWIIKEIWPKLIREFVPAMNDLGLKLWVVGRTIPDKVRKLTRDSNIIFDENAPKETELIYRKSDLLIAPIRIGGGTSFKILEGMASGVPVLTTALGNEGIGAKDGEEILVANDSNDFAKKISNVLSDRNLHSTLSKNARRFIEEKYDWRKIVERLESVYRSAI